MGYTKDDSIFDGFKKEGVGIITTAKLEQAKKPNAEVANWKLIDSVDIDWNNAKLSYIYAATNSYINDTSDLMHLIDDISHGNAIAWEEYVDEDEVDSTDSGNETPGTEDPTDPDEPLNPESPTEPSGE